MRLLRALLASCLLFVALAGCAPATGCGDPGDSVACTRVLFIGNSYTYVNDLPDTFGALARAGGHRVATSIAAQGGWTLADHAKSADTQALIASAKWDFVVLQEQSEIPSIAASRTDQMFPAARDLVRMVRNTGARPVFFLTWAHRDGWPENRLPDYASMQAQIDSGYMAIAKELGVEIAPVGDAWAAVLARTTRPNLWQDDGSHPTVAGTYLAACVFYAAVFHQSPVGVPFDGGLPRETTQLLQQAAAETVLTDQAHVP